MAAPARQQRDPHGVPIPDVSDHDAISLLNLTSRTAKMSDYIYTANESGSAMVVDGAPPGPLGRLFMIPPEEVVEVPEEVARQMEMHRAYDGIVRVTSTRSRSGVTFNIEDAHTQSLALLEIQDKKRFAQWVNDAVEDFIKRSKPVPPPSASILAIIKRRNYKPEDFGIVPIGWAKPDTAASIALKTENDSLRAQISDQADRLARMEKMIEKLSKEK